ncbi:hypothetical protein [Celeribacter marinus]|uniref:hypothetical protein n=1 Tax=Celeribacter marinus TaxID=1397108 RepID=UPI0031804FCC
MDSTYQLLRINGCRDTRSPNGPDYDTVTLADIAAMADAPLTLAKLDATAFVASSYITSDARSHSAQRRHGQFHAFVVDVDENGPPLEAVDMALTAIFGECARIIYSTSSASAETPKWRAIVPFLTAISGVQYEQLQRALFALLQAHGIACDSAMQGAAQMAFLPNVPPEMRDTDGTPLFFQSRVVAANMLQAPPLGLQERASLNAKREVDARNEAATLSRQRAAERLKVRERTGMPSPIEKFNADHDLTSVLLEYGWLSRGGPWYASPFSQSKGASVRVFDQRAVSFTSSDNGRVGKQTPKGWITYDAWDVFVACEHAGNERAALTDYCERSGYNPERCVAFREEDVDALVQSLFDATQK